MSFSDYIVYVDESGDHGLASINPQNPVFVLTFCIFEKEVYRLDVVPRMQALKFAFWGHDGVVLHSRDIRKSSEEFSILLNETVRTEFMMALNDVIGNTPVTLIAAAIDKQRLVERYATPNNPYKIALTFCMERLQMFLAERDQTATKTWILVERRGKKEDVDLELEFRRIAGGANAVGPMPNLDIRFMDKKHNSAGLQLADLFAYPIARHILDPRQSNRAFDILFSKFRTGRENQVSGYGLKIFP